MKTVCKKLLSLMLVAILLVSAVPFQASATEGEATDPETFSVYVTFQNGSEYPVVNYECKVTKGSVKASRLLEKTAKNNAIDLSNYNVTYPDGYTADSDITNAMNISFQLTDKVVAPTTYTVIFRYRDVSDNSVLATETISNIAANTVINARDYYTPNGYSFRDTAAQTSVTVTSDGDYNIYLTKNTTYYTVNYSVKVLNNTERIFSETYPEGQEITLNYGLVGEDSSSFGSSPTVTWKVDGVEKAHGTKITVNSNMNISFNVYSTNTATISLNANGGSVSPTTMTVVLGSPYPTLPEPTREGYTFQYWYRLNGSTEEKITSTTVATTAPLYAKWVANNITVTFQKYVGGDMNNGWETVSTIDVPAGSTVSKPDTSDFALSGYSIMDGAWEIGTTDTYFTFGSTKVTKNIVLRPRYERSVYLYTYNGNDTNASALYRTITVEVGEPITSLPSVSSTEGNVYAGWETASGTPVYSDTIYTSDLGNKFYVVWSDAVTVRLHVYTGGNVQTELRTIYYQAPKSGRFDLTAVNMHYYISNYDNYLDAVDKIYGWYTYTEWENFCAGVVPAYGHHYYDNLEEKGVYDFYIMLINNGTGTTYNTNTSTLDSSNPTTGDQIFMAVAVLAISATALAAIFFYNKKRQACK